MVPMPSSRVPKRSFGLVVAAGLVLSSCGIHGRELPTINEVASGDRTQILAADGSLITELVGDERRESLPIDQIPSLVQNAVISIEDERFWQHSGVDPKGVLRAVRSNSAAGGVTQGGSTITQQYIKNVLLSPDQNIQRKIQEASLAYQLEKSYSKSFILEQYLNTVYFGNRSYGIQQASRSYFGHPVSDITVPEAALLAGLVQSPVRNDPYRNPAGALARRNTVLRKMHELGYLSDQQSADAIATPITLVKSAAADAARRYPAAHFVEEVKRFIRSDPRFGATETDRSNLLVNGGLRIYTTIDLGMQAKAEDAVAKIYPNQNRAISKRDKDPDIGLVSIEAGTGYVRAMVGGYDYFDTNSAVHPYAQYNLAVGKGRQAGSTFKPIVLAAALANGVKPTTTFSAPPSLVIKAAGQPPWSVTGHALGPTASLTDCIAFSSNTCFANVINDPRVGVDRATEFAGKMGIDTSPWDPNTKRGFKRVLSLVLGSNDSTVLDMTEAYSTFMNRGLHTPATLVTKVVDARGTVLYEAQHTQTKVLEPETSDAITQMLEQVLIKGTAAGRGIDRPAAGKTGTTQSNTDAWFVGFTPELVTGVWAGYSQTTKRQVGSTGATAAEPVWALFMKSVLDGRPPRDFNFATTPDAKGTTTTTVAPSNTEIFQPAAPDAMAKMPALTDIDINEAAGRAKKAGVDLQRVIVTGPDGTPPGEVVAQSPAAGSAVPKGATVTIETTAGRPPPKGTVPNLVGLPADQAVASFQRSGYSTTQQLIAATPDVLMADGLPPASGIVWSVTPGAGQVSPDGRLVLRVQP